MTTAGTYKNILVPTNFSQGALQAVRLGAELASENGATLHLLNIVEIPMIPAPMLGAAAIPLLSPQVLLDDALGAVKQLASAYPDIYTVSAVRSGVTANAIAAYATEHDVDCIVIATHGRTGAARVFLGSTTESLVRLATCPVISVRPGARLPIQVEDVGARSLGHRT